MTCSRWLVWTALGATVAGLPALGRPARGESAESARVAAGAEDPKGRPVAKSKSPRHQAEDILRRALSRPATVDFDNTPLEDAVAFLERSHRIPILLDLESLVDVGIEPDVPVSLRVSDISLRSVLRLMLGQLHLTYVVRNEVVMITTLAEAENWEVVRWYSVGDLCGSCIGDQGISYDFDSLTDVIKCCVRPDSWGDGNQYFPTIDFGAVGAVVFAQTEDVHEEIASLLAALRSIARQTAEGKTPKPILFDRIWPEPPPYREIRRALSREVTFKFTETPLEEVIDHLRKTSGINIVLDRRALEDVGVPVDSRVSVNVANETLESVLRSTLPGLGLAHGIRDEVLLITTPEEAKYCLCIGVYPIGHLGSARNERPEMGYAGGFLERLIANCVEPKTWDWRGGPGTIHALDLEDLHVLVVASTPDGHRKTAEFLARIQGIARRCAQDPTADPVTLLQGVFDKTRLHKPLPRALSKNVRFDFHETPLAEVANSLARACGIECRLDQQPLHRIGMPADAPVSIEIPGITLHSALDLICGQLDLAWIVEDGVLLITTMERAERQLTLEIYRVDDLLTFRDQNGELWDDFHWLEQAVRCLASPGNWDDVGRDGWIVDGTFAGAKLLVVSQTDRGHEQISQLLDRLRQLRRQASPDGQPPRRDRYYGGFHPGGGFF